MAARTKQTSTPPAAIDPNKPAIPVVVRDQTAAPAKKTGASLLAGLAGKAKTAPKKSDRQDERPTLPLSPEAEANFAQFAPAKELLDVLTARVESLKGDLNPELLAAWTEMLWRNKAVPSNPSIEVKNGDKLDCKGMFIVQERFKVQIPDNNNPAESVTDLLKKLGLADADATRLVEQEIDFEPNLSLRPFNELVSGHYGEKKQFFDATAAEQAVGQKLLEFVQNNLTEEEQALVLLNTPKTVVKKGFLDRAPQYAQCKEQLEAILKVLVPVVQNKGAKFAVNDSPVEKTRRLLEEAAQILGSNSTDGDSDD